MSDKILEMEVEKIKKDKYLLPKKEVMKFYKDKHEIPEKAIKALKKANDELIEAGYVFAADKVCKIKEPVTVQIAGSDRMDVVAKAKTESPEIKVIDGKMTRTGNTVTKYGSCRVTVRKKVPSVFLKEGTKMSEAMARVEKALSK